MEKTENTPAYLIKSLVGKRLILEDGRQTPVIIGADFTKNYLKIWFKEKFGERDVLYISVNNL
jgi:hypothetical protein